MTHGFNNKIKVFVQIHNKNVVCNKIRFDIKFNNTANQQIEKFYCMCRVPKTEPFWFVVDNFCAKNINIAMYSKTN